MVSPHQRANDRGTVQRWGTLFQGYTTTGDEEASCRALIDTCGLILGKEGSWSRFSDPCQRRTRGAAPAPKILRRQAATRGCCRAGPAAGPRAARSLRWCSAARSAFALAPLSPPARERTGPARAGAGGEPRRRGAAQQGPLPGGSDQAAGRRSPLSAAAARASRVWNSGIIAGMNAGTRSPWRLDGEPRSRAAGAAPSGGELKHEGEGARTSKVPPWRHGRRGGRGGRGGGELENTAQNCR